MLSKSIEFDNLFLIQNNIFNFVIQIMKFFFDKILKNKYDIQ